MVDLVISPFFSGEILEQCARLGIKNVFIQPGACSAELLEDCKAKQITARQGCVLTVNFP